MKDNEMMEHPEGGRYFEVYRSKVQVTEKNRSRPAITHIYFSLNGNEVSRFHKVENDEIWNLYEGEGILLYIWNPDTEQLEITELSEEKREYCCVVQSGFWQAAKPKNGKVLVGCSVAPGFEFEDFELIDPKGKVASQILQSFPHVEHLL